MAGFVGFCVQSNGISWPWPLQGGAFGGETIQFADIAAAGGPGDQWDALPSSAKLQIIIFVGFLESLGEDPRFLPDGKHYTRGGRPGTFPSLKKLNEVEGSYVPHPVPFDLFDPFGFQKRMSPERKAKALVAELNNGRLAMVGLMGLLSVSKGLKVPVSTRSRSRRTRASMAPFSATDTLPFVKDMVEASARGGAASATTRRCVCTMLLTISKTPPVADPEAPTSQQVRDDFTPARNFLGLQVLSSASPQPLGRRGTHSRCSPTCTRAGWRRPARRRGSGAAAPSSGGGLVEKYRRAGAAWGGAGRRAFDLRYVERLQPSDDATAPPLAFEVVGSGGGGKSRKFTFAAWRPPTAAAPARARGVAAAGRRRRPGRRRSVAAQRSTALAQEIEGAYAGAQKKVEVRRTSLALHRNPSSQLFGPVVLESARNSGSGAPPGVAPRRRPTPPPARTPPPTTPPPPPPRRLRSRPAAVEPPPAAVVAGPAAAPPASAEAEASAVRIQSRVRSGRGATCGR